MKYHKRAIILIKNQWLNQLILFLIVFILGFSLLFTSGINNGIELLELNLLQRLTPVAVIEPDNPRIDFLPRAKLKEISNLPYVKEISISTSLTIENFKYERYIPQEIFNDYIQQIINNLGNFKTNWTLQDLKGINDKRTIEFEVGRFNLYKGRYFSETELNDNSFVTMIPYEFASINNLQIGDFLSLEYNIFPKGVSFFEILQNRPANEDMMFHLGLEFQIIGIFKIEPLKLIVENLNDAITIVNLYNTPMVPHGIIEYIISESLDAQQISIEYLMSKNKGEGFFIPQEDHLTLNHAVFLLNSPNEFNSFRLAVGNILGDDWRVSGTDSVFQPILSAFYNINSLVHLMKIITIVSSIIALFFVILLSLKNRYHEIAIYISLGEKMKNIFKQILVEKNIVVFLGVFASFMISGPIVKQLSNSLITREILNQIDSTNHYYYGQNVNLPNYRIFQFRTLLPTIEEVLDLYSVNFTHITFMTILLIAVGTMTITLTIFLWNLNKKNPNDIFKKSSR